MKQHFLILICLMIFQSSFAQSIEGKWINYKNGKPEVLIELYETVDGMIEGKVVEIFDSEVKGLSCDKCNKDDSRYDQPLLGMVVFTGLEPKENKTKAVEGRFLHTRSGKSYNTFVELQDDPNYLDVRGYLGIKALGKTYTWKRQ